MSLPSLILSKNEVLHKKIGFLFTKLQNIQIQNGPPAAILNFASRKFTAVCSRGSPLKLCS